jgi:DNA-binding NarL/FixJ family response regulator
MNIIIIEDNEFKRKKLYDFLIDLESIKTIDTAFSYSSGLNKCLNNNYDLLILDMSMPTYDKSTLETGGRFRTYGGKEILRQLKRKNKSKPFIVVSQYPKFSENEETLSLEEIGNSLFELFPIDYLGLVFYDTSSAVWKSELEKLILGNIE